VELSIQIPITMPRIKLVSLNTEWMTNFFETRTDRFWQGASKSQGMGSKPKDVQAVCARLAGLIKTLKADVIGIQEGPPRKAQMQRFVKDFLADAYTVHSMPHGSQSNHALVRKGLAGITAEQVGADHPIYKSLSKKLAYYTWDSVDLSRREAFTRKPVVRRLTDSDGHSVELISLHTKSKISELKSPKDWNNRDRPKILDALRSRQKLSAEVAAVRRYLSEALLSGRVDGCIVMGDLNDGPNRELFEEEFLIHNIVDELRGGFDCEPALMHHALPHAYMSDPARAFTTDFDDPTLNGQKIHEMLDHILVSNYLVKSGSHIRIDRRKSKVEHEPYEASVVNNGKTRDDRPCDHRPISTEIVFK
jgi:endonuclease/exonuclease/phosphatase family metal-dependent hydrolase